MQNTWDKNIDKNKQMYASSGQFIPMSTVNSVFFIIYILRFTPSFLHEKFRLKNCDSQSQQRNGFLTRAIT